MDPWALLDILFFLVFLGLSTLFFAGEFAFFSVSVDVLERNGGRRTGFVMRMLANPNELMISLLLGSSLCSVLAALFALRLTWLYWAEGPAKIVASAVCLVIVGLLVAVLGGPGPGGGGPKTGEADLCAICSHLSDRERRGARDPEALPGRFTGQGAAA